MQKHDESLSRERAVLWLIRAAVPWNSGEMVFALFVLFWTELKLCTQAKAARFGEYELINQSVDRGSDQVSGDANQWIAGQSSDGWRVIAYC